MWFAASKAAPRISWSKDISNRPGASSGAPIWLTIAPNNSERSLPSFVGNFSLKVLALKNAGFCPGPSNFVLELTSISWPRTVLTKFLAKIGNCLRKPLISPNIILAPSSSSTPSALLPKNLRVPLIFPAIWRAAVWNVRFNMPPIMLPTWVSNPDSKLK